MKPIKRVEIIVDSLEVENIISIIERHEISGYTLISDVLGKGDRGIRDGEGLTNVFKNSILIIACEKEKVEEFVEEIRLQLKKFGGVCLVSDAEWIIH